MINYRVKSGDTLSTIAYRYQTTTKILMADNSIIKNANQISVGWTLKIRTTVEYAKAQTAKAKTAVAKSTAVSKSVAPVANLSLSPSTTGVYFKGLTVYERQTGIVTLTRAAYLYTFSSSGVLKALSRKNKNQRFRTFSYTSKSGGLYEVTGGYYVRKSDVSFEKLPETHKFTNQVGTSILKTDSKKIPNKSATANPSSFMIPQLEPPGHRRTRIQVKKPDNKNLNMELRLLAFNAGHSNQFSANRTNAGWMINVGGKNLSTITLSGFFLDTRVNREADDFVKNYHQYFVPVSSDKYFKAMIATILHKGREYKGFITALNLSEQADSPLDRKFTMQFLVLKEKGLSSEDVAKSYPMVVNRGGLAEADFLSSVKGMLSNVVNGAYK